jgi:CheY-like chemotaxis protein
MQIGVEIAKAVDNKRIFVVDDDEVTRAALQFMLHDENETHEFADLDAALSKARDWRPDLLIIDAARLRTGAQGLIAELKKRIAGLRVVVTLDQAGAGDWARQRGADGVIGKPLSIEGTRGVVDEVLGRAAADLTRRVG